MPRFDIRRQVREVNTSIGGVATTSTAIETRFIDLQHIIVRGASERLLGAETIDLGGLRVEALHRGFCHEDTNIRESDTISRDSGISVFQILFVQTGWDEHTEFLAQRKTGK